MYGGSSEDVKRGDGFLHRRGTGDLVKEFFAEGQRLVKEELHLAKAEIKDEAKSAGKASGSIVAGGLIAYVGFFFFMAFVTIALASVIPWWASALIVGVLLLAVGGILISGGLKKLRDIKPANETQRTLQEDKAWASETMRAVRSRTRANA